MCYNIKMNKYVVDIFDVSYQGAGVARIDNQIVFVPKTLKSEKVRVSVVKRSSSFLIGKPEEILSPSLSRIQPKCPYFDICGGCDFQHCDGQEEKRIKIDIIKNELKKVNYLGEVTFTESQNRFGYRNKIKLEVKNGKIGYFKEKSRDFFEVDSCVIASLQINKLLPTVKQFLECNNFEGIKSVYLKQVGEDVAVCFLFEKNREKVTKKPKKLDIFDGFSVFFAFGEVLESDSTKIYNLLGASKLIKKIGDLEVEVDVSSFNQINDEVAEKLYTFVEEFCDKKRVVNAYSGQGLLTYRIAQKAKFVYGIEYQKSAHQSAEKLCASCEEYKIENICGRVETCLQEVLAKDRIDTLVLDPPREGCDKDALMSILEAKIESVVYVSCNFATLVRDLKILSDSYFIEEVKIFDMFPCCVSMETVAILRKKA